MSVLKPIVGAGAAGIAGLLAPEESEAGLLYTASKTAAREAAERLAKKSPGFRPPIVAEIAPNQYMTDAAGKPIPGKGGRKYMGKGKGTQYLPIATDPAERELQSIWAYVDLEKALKEAGTGKGSDRRRRGALNHFMHQKNDYERWSPLVRDTYDNGLMGGDAWKLGMDAKYEEMIERVPEEFHPDVEKYFYEHVMRPTAKQPHPRFDPNKRQKGLDPLPAATGAGLLAAGGAKASTGGTSEANGFAPWPEYDPTPVSQRNQDIMFGGPMGALGGSFSGGMDEYGTVADGTMQSMQAGGRLLYGLLSGEGWGGATDNAGKVIQQGVDQTQQQFGDYISDKTGDDTLGFYAKWLPYLVSPL